MHNFLERKKGTYVSFKPVALSFAGVTATAHVVPISLSMYVGA